MREILLRTLKRVTALEGSADEFRAIVFDRENLSVYEVVDGSDEVTRAHAEHAAKFLQRPMPRDGIALLATDGGDVDHKVKGETGFEFTDTRHREICFLDAAEVESIALRVFDERVARARHASADELRSYARARLLANDKEWQSTCAEKPKWMACAKRDGD